MKRCKLKITIVATYDAEFEDTPAASEMIKALESDSHPTAPAPLSITTGRWRIQMTKRNPTSVQVIDEPFYEGRRDE